MAYEDDETLEQLRHAWERYGKTLLVLIAAAVLGGVGGRWYQSHVAAQAEAASTLYGAILEAPDYPTVAPLVQRMLEQHDGSPYATLAQMRVAPLAVDAGNRAAAEAALRWIMDNGAEATDRDLARLRLARLKLDDGDAEAAAAVLKDVAPESFAVDHAELEGDVAQARRDLAAARTAYRTALGLAGEDAARTALLQLKLDDLGS